MYNHDYGTGSVEGTNVIDLTTTGVSFYNDFLSKNPSVIDSLKKSHNLVGTVVMMSPQEYFEQCSKYGFPNKRHSVQNLKLTRMVDVSIIDHLKNVLTVDKKKFPMPYINKAEHSQEGLHRMLVIGELFGWNHKVPVLVVEWADEDLAKEQKRNKLNREIEYMIQQAVKAALRFSYRDVDELRDQLQWELDDVFRFNSVKVKTPVKFTLVEEPNEFIVSVSNVSYGIDKSDVSFEELPEQEEIELDDIEIDDIELDDIDDFLVGHLEEDRRETPSHNVLESGASMNESVEQSDIKQMDDIIQSRWAFETPGDGCIFIAPNGKFINIYPELDDHEDLCYWLEELEDYEFDTPEDAEWFVSAFGYVRCRNSMHLCFIEVPQKMTSAQYYSLERWLEEKVSSDKLDIEAWSGEWKTYKLDDYFPEDIIKIIKRSYASGKLYEKLK